MQRKSKALGCAALIVAAMGVAAAASASGGGGEENVLTTASGEPVTLVGAELGKITTATTAFGGQTSCPGSIVTGHKAGATPHIPVPNGSSTITVSPHINQENCFAQGPLGTFPLTIKTNGCDTLFHIGEAIGEESYGGSSELVCPEGQVYESIVYNNAAHSESVCVLKIAPQTIVGSAEVTNTSGTLEVTGTVSGIHITRTGLCLLDGQGTTTNAGAIHGGGTLKGFNEEGEPLGIAISPAG